MLVNRRTFHIKHGYTEQTLALLRDTGQKFLHPQGRAVRIYVADIGQFDTIAFEIEYANLAEYEAYWNALATQEWINDFFTQWHELAESGGSNEIWQVETA